MKEKVRGTKIIALIILLSIAVFSILASKYIMTMKSTYNNIIEGVDFYQNKYKYLSEYVYNNYFIELPSELPPLD